MDEILAEEGMEFMEEPLVDKNTYFLSGIHIGTKQKSRSMEKFFYKIRSDGLCIMDIRKTDDRVRICAKFLAQFPSDKILTVSSRQYGQQPIVKFSECMNAKAIPGRFMPGTLTNRESPNYIEPEVIIITDPIGDPQALREAICASIPVIAFCDANNDTRFVDIVIPTNNKGKKALAFMYWLLARETLKAKNMIQNNEEFKLEIEDFEGIEREQKE